MISSQKNGKGIKKNSKTESVFTWTRINKKPFFFQNIPLDIRSIYFDKLCICFLLLLYKVVSLFFF